MKQNRKIKTIILFFVILQCSFLNCCITQIRPLPEGGFRPKINNFDFAKKPFVNVDNLLIDTNAIYIDKIINTTPKLISGDTLYTFYRFFRNGQAYNSLNP
jgi:hypothetical protein